MFKKKKKSSFINFIIEEGVPTIKLEWNTEKDATMIVNIINSMGKEKFVKILKEKIIKYGEDSGKQEEAATMVENISADFDKKKKVSSSAMIPPNKVIFHLLNVQTVGGDQ